MNDNTGLSIEGKSCMSHYKADSGEPSENPKRDCLCHDLQRNICGCQRVEKVAGKQQACVQLSSNVDNFSEFIRNVQMCKFIKLVGYKIIYISKMESCKSLLYFEKNRHLVNK